MADWNWRDEFEEKTSLGGRVLNIVKHFGDPYALVESACGRVCVTDKGTLIRKPKPKKFRPWTRDEVPVGSVVKSSNGFRGVIVGVSSCSDLIRVSDSSHQAKYVLENFTLLDGSPCGTVEE